MSMHEFEREVAKIHKRAFIKLCIDTAVGFSIGVVLAYIIVKMFF